MKQYILAIVACILFLSSAKAQYTAQGKITFVRKVNIHRQLDDMMEDDNKTWLEQIKLKVPKFNVTNFDYYFNLNNSLYKPGKAEEEAPVKSMFGNSPASDNIVYTDFKNDKVVASKKVFEQTFLETDTIRKIEWKIEDEIRTIANFKCRKAVGKICDSVYVVAFYSEDIMVSGGPEMFAGLPGMILELAIPRLYSTWIASKIDITPPKAEEIKAPEKGKKVTQQELYETINASVSKWGKFAQRSIWWSML